MSLEFTHITKAFGKRRVLNDLSLSVKRGEFHVVLGPSGEGKSTLLTLAAGLHKPDAGEIRIHDRLVNSVPPQQRNIGFVFQDYALFPHLSVAENVAAGLSARGLKKPQMKKRVAKYLELVKLLGFEDSYPAHLSGGQRQRVALARALAIEPTLLLLDEPLNSLDASLQEELMLDLRELQRSFQVTTVYVTHNREEAMKLGDRVSVMHKGEIMQTEAPERLFYHPNSSFVASFLGTKNILPVELLRMQGDMVRLRVVHPDLKDELELEVSNYPIFSRKASLKLCVHPEKLHLSEEPQHVNSFPANIVSSDVKGLLVDVVVDVGGLHLNAHVPRMLFPQQGKKVWLGFPPDAAHPMCGRSHQKPEHQRKCKHKGMAALLSSGT